MNLWKSPMMRCSINIILLSCGCWFAGCAGAPPVSQSKPSPLGVRYSQRDSDLAANRRKFLSFTHANHPGQHVGYRFFEHEPMVRGAVPRDAAAAGIESAYASRLQREFANRAGVFTADYSVNDEGWIRQDWRLYFAPAADGLDVLLVIQTHEEGLPEWYAIQQCLRMGGKTNIPWRREVACSPAFSEYDIWAREAHQGRKTSLSYVHMNGEWLALPAEKEAVGARTPLGKKYDWRCYNGVLPERVGPYQARMLGTMDDMAIARRSEDGQWVCGMYWQGMTHMSNHHPADCLHAVVNIGNVPANCKRAVLGKIYWFLGNLEDLANKVAHDFHIHQQSGG
jgi:hypothetical protein